MRTIGLLLLGVFLGAILAVSCHLVAEFAEDSKKFIKGQSVMVWGGV